MTMVNSDLKGLIRFISRLSHSFLGMKGVFKRQVSQMFGVKLNK